MTMTRIGAVLALGLLLAVFDNPAAQDGVAASQPHIQDAIAARDAGDYAAFTAALEQAARLNPASYFTRYNLARGYAQTGRHDEAFAVLDRLADANVDFGVADDERLAPLRGDPRYAALLERLDTVTTPAGDAQLRHRVRRGDLVAEGIAWDPTGERLFFGSMRNGEVYVFDADGQLSRFAAVEHEGRALAAIGMTVDAARERLWVIGTDFFLAEGYVDGADIVSGVFGFDLATGELAEHYLRDDVGQGYNDVTVAPNGDLYLSGAEIGRLPFGGDAIETLATSEPLFGTNGIVVTPDGSELIVSSYPAAIAVIRLEDGEARFPEPPADLPLYGIDGMYLHEGDLVAVQNGVRPWRLMRFEMNDAKTRITAGRALVFGDPQATPTTGAIVGDAIHYVGQAPADAEPPSHLPEALHPYFGNTLIMTAPLD